MRFTATLISYTVFVDNQPERHIMVKSNASNPSVLFHIRKIASLLAQSLTWVTALVAVLLVVLAFLDIVLSITGIYYLDDHLIVTLPGFQSFLTWLIGFMCLGFSIHHLVRPDTRIDLACKWGLAALVCAVVYWF